MAGVKHMATKTKLPTLDLHGYREDEVFDAIEGFLSKHTNADRVRIMTGKGKGVVKAEAQRYLKLAKYHFSSEKNEKGVVNDGVILVFVN